MICHLTGKLVEVNAPEIVIECQGVGYELSVPMTCVYQLPDVGNTVTVYTHFQVREDAHQLFGFVDRKNRALFKLLIKINGVGPKLALAILSGMDRAQFISCIQHGEIQRLVKIPGVGKKTAERLVIEMKDKIKDYADKVDTVAIVASGGRGGSVIEDAMSALVALGYKESEARKAVQQFEEETSSETLIRKALQNMLGR